MGEFIEVLSLDQGGCNGNRATDSVDDSHSIRREPLECGGKRYRDTALDWLSGTTALSKAKHAMQSGVALPLAGALQRVAQTHNLAGGLDDCNKFCNRNDAVWQHAHTRVCCNLHHRRD